jgi:hypothetical protein
MNIVATIVMVYPWCKTAMKKGFQIKIFGSLGYGGRGERIRTSGLYVPNVALYQAKLHPDFKLHNLKT